MNNAMDGAAIRVQRNLIAKTLPGWGRNDPAIGKARLMPAWRGVGESEAAAEMFAKLFNKKYLRFVREKIGFFEKEYLSQPP
jgi:hypothetical protein